MFNALYQGWLSFWGDVTNIFQPPRRLEPKLLPKPELEPEWPRLAKPPLSSYPNRADYGSRSILTRSTRVSGYPAQPENEADRWPRAV